MRCAAVIGHRYAQRNYGRYAVAADALRRYRCCSVGALDGDMIFAAPPPMHYAAAARRLITAAQRHDWRAMFCRQQPLFDIAMLTLPACLLPAATLMPCRSFMPIWRCAMAMLRLMHYTLIRAPCRRLDAAAMPDIAAAFFRRLIAFLRQLPRLLMPALQQAICRTTRRTRVRRFDATPPFFAFMLYLLIFV